MSKLNYSPNSFFGRNSFLFIQEGKKVKQVNREVILSKAEGGGNFFLQEYERKETKFSNISFRGTKEGPISW